MSAVLVAVDVPTVGDERHKHWAKVVTNVDAGKSSGWAYEGDFVLFEFGIEEACE